MPTAMRRDGLRMFFYSNEGEEPAHVHVERRGATAEFWLIPVESAQNSGFSAHEVRKIRRVVIENANYLREVWRELFGA